MKTVWLRAALLAAVVWAAACGSQETTPSGIVGTYDLRSSLGSAVAAKAPADNCARVAECPVDAIYADHDVPEQHRDDIARNAAFFRR